MNYNLLGTSTKLRSVCICTNPNATWWQMWNTLNSQENQQGDCTRDPSCTTRQHTRMWPWCSKLHHKRSSTLQWACRLKRFRQASGLAEKDNCWDWRKGMTPVSWTMNKPSYGGMDKPQNFPIGMIHRDYPKRGDVVTLSFTLNYCYACILTVYLCMHTYYNLVEYHVLGWSWWYDISYNFLATSSMLRSICIRANP